MDIKQNLTAKEPFPSVRNCTWNLDVHKIQLFGKAIRPEDVRFYRVESLRRSEDVSFSGMMENVLASLSDPAFCYVYLLTGTPSGITIHMGVARNHEKQSHFSNAWNYGEILRSAFQSNLTGSIIIPEEKTDALLDSVSQYQRSCFITGIPSVADARQTGTNLRTGLDLLVSGCSDMNWRLMVIAEPVLPEVVLNHYEAICEIYGNLNRSSKNSVQNSTSAQHSEADAKTRGSSDTHTEAKSGGKNEGETIRSGNSHDKNKGGHDDWSKSDAKTKQESSSHTQTKGNSDSESVSFEIISKNRMELMNYIDEVLLKRYHEGISRRMFRTSIYLFSDTLSDLMRAQSLFCSAFGQNPEERNAPHVVSLDFLQDRQKDVLFSSMQSDVIRFPADDANQLLFGHTKVSQNEFGISTLLTAKEVAVTAGIPEHEAVGIPLRSCTDFGLNSISDNNGICLGNLLNNGVEMHERKVFLPHPILNRHVLVAGVTGSGKTTTCQKLILEADCPFLVIEPAKTEYRALLHTALRDKIKIFTLGNEGHSPFRMNPFELLPDENFTSHVDMLTASFTSSFPMEAAMPQILEEAIYRCYSNYGWIASTGTNAYTDSPYTEDGRYFPVLNDLINVIPEVVKEKNFGAQMNADYVGSLTGRISNLLTGSKGCMLNCRKSIDFLELLDGYVILELEDLRSGNDKAFVMGLILARLSESLKIRHHLQHDFRHITLIEEAHRLLSREEHSSAKRAAVESFTDLLAEVRKYGESLIIADQIPNKLAPDVIKNTNTKIIHKLFATDDKNAIGDAMMMEQTQKEFLSSLLPGEVVVFTETTPKPVNLRILSRTNTSEEVADAEIQELFANMRKQYDKLIADGCIFRTLTSEQRYSLDCDTSKYDQLVEILEKRIPFDEKKREIALEKMKLFCNLLEQIAERAGMSIQAVWEELAWRYLVGSGIARKNFKGLENLFSRISGIYALIDAYIAGNGEFPKEELEALRRKYET